MPCRIFTCAALGGPWSISTTNSQGVGTTTITYTLTHVSSEACAAGGTYPLKHLILSHILCSSRYLIRNTSCDICRRCVCAWERSLHYFDSLAADLQVAALPRMQYGLVVWPRPLVTRLPRSLPLCYWILSPLSSLPCPFCSHLARLRMHPCQSNRSRDSAHERLWLPS
jgi:hypothetical protein